MVINTQDINFSNRGMVINSQDTNFSAGGMIIKTQDTNLSMVIYTRDFNTQDI